MLKKPFRLRNNKQFRFTYKKGKSLVGNYVVLYYFKHKENINHYGFSVSKKIGKAVVRNRVKRILRECCRMNINQMEQGYNIVLVAKSKIKGINYWLINEDIVELFRKADIWKG